jgi:SpoIIAA-like
MAGKGFEKQVLEDGIIIYRAHSADREVVDAWYDDVGSVFSQSFEQGRPVRLVYDVRNIGLVTPHAIQRAEELEKLAVTDDWRVATLVGTAFLANMVNYVISVSLLPEMRSKSRVFSDEAEALAWLRS